MKEDLCVMEMPDEYISGQGCFNCEWDNINWQCQYRKACGYEDYKEWALKFMEDVEVDDEKTADGNA